MLACAARVASVEEDRARSLRSCVVASASLLWLLALPACTQRPDRMLQKASVACDCKCHRYS